MWWKKWMRNSCAILRNPCANSRNRAQFQKPLHFTPKLMGLMGWHRFNSSHFCMILSLGSPKLTDNCSNSVHEYDWWTNYPYTKKSEEHLRSIDPISHMSGSKLGSCETLMAGTATLGNNSRDHQAVTMDLDELIRAPCLYTLFESNISMHGINIWFIYVYLSYFMCQRHEAQEEKIRLLRASLASDGDEAKDAPPLIEGETCRI